MTVYIRTNLGTSVAGGGWSSGGWSSGGWSSSGWSSSNYSPSTPGYGGNSSSGYAEEVYVPPPVEPINWLDDPASPATRGNREITVDYSSSSDVRAERLILSDAIGTTQSSDVDRPSEIDLETLALAEIEQLCKDMRLSRVTRNALIRKMKTLRVNAFAEALTTDTLLLDIAEKDDEVWLSFSTSILEIASLDDVEPVVAAAITSGNYIQRFVAASGGLYSLVENGANLDLYGWSNDTGWTLVEASIIASDPSAVLLPYGDDLIVYASETSMKVYDTSAQTITDKTPTIGSTASSFGDEYHGYDPLYLSTLVSYDWQGNLIKGWASYWWEDRWTGWGSSPTRIDANTLTVSDDCTGIFTAGALFSCLCDGTRVNGVVENSSFSEGVTTVNLTTNILYGTIVAPGCYVSFSDLLVYATSLNVSSAENWATIFEGEVV